MLLEVWEKPRSKSFLKISHSEKTTTPKIGKKEKFISEKKKKITTYLLHFSVANSLFGTLFSSAAFMLN